MPNPELTLRAASIAGRHSVRNDGPLGRRLSEFLYKNIAPEQYPSNPNQIKRITKNILTGGRMKDPNEIKKMFDGMMDYHSFRESKEKYLDILNDEIENSNFGKVQKRIRSGEAKTIDDLNKLYDERDSHFKEYKEIRRIIDEVKKAPVPERIHRKSKKWEETAAFGGRVDDEDAWRFFLGIDQINNTVKPSNYKPTRASNDDSKYYTLLSDDQKDHLRMMGDKIVSQGGKFPQVIETGITSLANATIDLGKDDRGQYYSIYDIYDFDVPGQKFFGTPYEIYDRIYLNDYNKDN